MNITFFSFLLLVHFFFGNKPVEKTTEPKEVNTIFQTSDGGQTWNDATAGLPKDLQPGYVYAGGGEIFLISDKGMYHSIATSSATLWEKQFFPVDEISYIFPGKAGPFAYSEKYGFFQEMFGSGIWLPASSALKDIRVNALVELKDGSILVGSDGGIYKSTDGMLTWNHIYNEESVFRLYEVDGVLLSCGTKGLSRSTDSGDHWNSVSVADGKVIDTQPIDGGIAGIFIGDKACGKQVNSYGFKNGLLVSTDNGINWERIDQGLPDVRDIRDIIQAGKYLFCSLNTGIYRSSNSGATWELVLPATGKTFFDLSVTGHMVYATKVFGGC